MTLSRKVIQIQTSAIHIQAIKHQQNLSSQQCDDPYS